MNPWNGNGTETNDPLAGTRPPERVPPEGQRDGDKLEHRALLAFGKAGITREDWDRALAEDRADRRGMRL